MKEKNSRVKKSWPWKIMEYLSYFLVFSAPLYFNNAYKIFIFGAPKEILIVGIVLMITVFYLWGILTEDKLSFRITPLHIISLVFIAVITLSSIFGTDPLNSFFGRWTEGISLILIYALALFAFLVGSLIKKDKSFIPRILLVSLASSLCVVVISYTGGSWMEIFKDGSSTIGNNSYTGAYLLFNACFGLGLLTYYSKIWQKILLGIATLFIILSPIFVNQDILLGKIGLSQILSDPYILFGMANAASVGLFVSFVVAVVFFLIFSKRRPNKIVGVIALFLVLFGSLYTGFELINAGSRLNHTYLEIKGQGRFISWNSAIESFRDYPLLGFGFNNFSYAYQKHFTADVFKSKYPELFFNQPHNIILEYASNNGLLGLLAFLSLIFFTFIALFRQNDEEDNRDKKIKIILIATLFGYFIQNLFGFDTPTTYLMLFLVIGLAIGTSAKDWVFIVPEKRNDGYKFIGSIGIILSLASFFLFVILPIKELRGWGVAASTENVKQREAERETMQATSLLGGIFDSAYLAEKTYEAYESNINNIDYSKKNIYLEDIQSLVNFVEKDMEKQPDNVESYLVVSRLLNTEIFIEGKVEESLWNQSLDHVKKALVLNSQNPEAYLLLGETYVLRDDFKDVFLSIRQALAIAPEYAKSYEYADKLLKIKPDINFQKYIERMRKIWITN